MTSTTTPPEFVTDEAVTYSPREYRPLTEAQTRAVLAYAMYAQAHERLEVRWVDKQMVCQLVKCEEKRRV